MVPNRALTVLMGLLYVPSAATLAKASSRSSRGTRTWSSHIYAAMAPIMPGP